jgi:diguanylate cyclase (GGDEF)-like protein/PAS domain S-box-containing protein
VSEPSDGRLRLLQAIRLVKGALEEIDRPACRAAMEALTRATAEIADDEADSGEFDPGDPLAAALATQLHRRVEDALADRNRQFRDILNACPLGVAVISRQGWKRLFVNQNMADLFKAPSIEAFQQQGLQRSWVDQAAFARASANIESDVDHVDFECERICFDGSTIWVLMNSRPIMFEGQPARVFWHNDITKRKQMEDELRRLATTDTVTGLPNRRHLLGLIDREAKRNQRYGSSFGLLMLDVDNFKNINDSYGHASGDQVLHRVAQLCLATVRDIDTLGRVGGEEFAVLVPDSTEAGTRYLAERLRRVVADTVIEIGSDCRLSVTISVGATLHRNDDGSVDATLARADKALYQAKRAGRDCIRFL